MSTIDKALRLPSVDDEDIGRRLRDRRIRMGISVRQLAEEAGVDRGRLAKLEAGEANVRDTTVGKVSATIARLEQEMGMNDLDADEGGMVEFRVSGSFGVDIVVKGPVQNLDALEGSVARLLARMRAESGDSSPSDELS